MSDYVLHPIGVIHSPLKDRMESSSQGNECVPEAWLLQFGLTNIV